MQGIGLLLDQIGKLVPVLMGESKGNHDRLEVVLVRPGDSLGDLFAPALLDFRGANRARPHIAASHQAGVKAATVLT